MQATYAQIWILSLWGTSLAAAVTPPGAALTPAGLLCEYQVAPVGLDVTAPRLSWHVTSPRRGARQTAYRIRVASSAAALAQGRPDLWDTGKVVSDRTLHVPYAGRTLSSGQTCCWQVRVWDRDDRPSVWSPAGRWTMGLLPPDRWTGRWLGYTRPFGADTDRDLRDGWRQRAPSPLLRRAFRVDRPVQRALLFVCGLGFHEAYLNGHKVGDHVLDPAFTRYDRACLYVTHEVTDRVHVGDNAVGIMLGNGWYNVFTRAAWDFDQAPWRDRPKVLAQLLLEYADGSRQWVVTDERWRAATGPIVLDGIRQGETYDARRERSGWTRADYDDGAWAPAEVVTAPAGTLRAQNAPPIRVIETLSPARITEPRPGVFVVDLGRNIAGWLRLQVQGPAGTRVRLRYGERLGAEGTLDQAAIARHVKDPVFQTDTYILAGRGTETWEPRFTYHGFQYVEITGWPGRPRVSDLVGCVVHTDFPRAGQFRCSQGLLNRIQEATGWSYRGNFVGYPTDCPHREKNGWTGDAQLAVQQAAYNWFNPAGYTRWMLDFRDEQRPTGELPGIVPTGGWGYAWGNGPAWDSAYLIIPWTLYQAYGDTRILAEHYRPWTRYVDYLTSRAEDHIVSLGLGDWVPAHTKTPTAVTSTVFYYQDARILAQSAALLGHAEDAARYGALADAIGRAFHAHFYRGNGAYANSSQTALSAALFYGLVPAAERPAVVRRLVANVVAADFHIDTGILGARWLFHVLSENGAHDVAYRLATQTTAPSYGHWFAQGATTLWEDWPGASSRNHIMFGDISAWFYRELAGIRWDDTSPETVAYKHTVLRPRPVAGLTQAAGSVATMRGPLRSAWRHRDGRFLWDVEVPANTTATLHVPTPEPGSVTESDRPATEAEAVRFLRHADGTAVFQVEAGTYHFAARLP